MARTTVIGIPVYGLKVRTRAVFDICPDCKGRIGRQGPWRCGPGQDINIGIGGFKKGCGMFIPDHLELGHHGGILYIAVASRLVQFMGAES